MILRFNYIVKESSNVRSLKDKRFKVNQTIVSYIGDDGNEYRKSFESKNQIEVPKIGTHEQINKLKYQ